MLLLQMQFVGRFSACQSPCDSCVLPRSTEPPHKLHVQKQHAFIRNLTRLEHKTIYALRGGIEATALNKYTTSPLKI